MAETKRGLLNTYGIRRRVILTLGVIAVLTVGFLSNTLYRINSLSEEKKALINRDIPTHTSTTLLTAKVNEVTHLLNLWIKNNGEEKYKEMIALAWENDIKPLIPSLREQYDKGDNDDKKILTGIQNQLSSIQISQEQMITSESPDLEQYSATLTNEIYPQLEGFNLNIQLLRLKQIEKIEIAEDDLSGKISDLQMILYLAITLTILILLIAGWLLVKYYLQHLQRIKKPLEQINQGDIPEKITEIDDESNEILDEIRNLTVELEHIKNIAIKIGEGEFDAEISVFENRGEVGTALEGMRKSLRNVAVEDQQRNWLNAGYAKFGDILRENNNEISVLCEQVIKNLVKYLDANQGALFLLEGEGEEARMVIKSAYAYERAKKIDSDVIIGEGLVGQAWQENDAIYITDVPDNYVNIRSGLGDANPKSIFVVPLRNNEEVVGVVEVASFHEIQAHQKEFIEKVTENIAAAISNTTRNEQTNRLLGESQQMTEEMRAQEEEMRQNMEELEATQEEMDRAQKEIGRKESNLNALINNTEDTIFAIDTEYRITVVNDTLKNKYKGLGINLEVGTHIYDALNDDQWKVWKPRYDRALAGERYTKIEESSASEGKKFVETFHNPIFDQDQKVIGVSVISRNITNTIVAQQEAEQKTNTLNALINNSEDTYFAMDLEYRITVANETLKKRFAATGIELLEGDNIFDKLPKESHKVWKERYDRSLAGESFTIDQERKVNENTLYIRGYYNPIKDQEGKIIGASVRSSDITEMKSIMDELESVKSELNQLKK